MAPVIKAFQKESLIQCKICVTGQHREMLDQVLEFFEIKPEYDLNIMKHGQDLYDITTSILLHIKEVLNDFKPDIVLVHGDTTTALSTALATFYENIKLGHIEAGLRTGNIYSPFPEEMNRLLCSSISNYHFAPTDKSRNNLLRENKDDRNIMVTGNTVIDALFLTLDKIKSDKNLELKIKKQIPTINNNKKIILVTGHRRENHGQNFINICEALKILANKNQNIDIIYPLHLNPKVQKPARELLSCVSNIHLIQPLRYEQFVYLMHKSYFIITDSGGIQEEAPSLFKPVLLTRNTTERSEAIEAGAVKLVGTNTENIIKQAQKLIDDRSEYEKMIILNNPYGDGYASNRIVEFIKRIEINGK